MPLSGFTPLWVASAPPRTTNRNCFMRSPDETVIPVRQGAYHDILSLRAPQREAIGYLAGDSLPRQLVIH